MATPSASIAAIIASKSKTADGDSSKGGSHLVKTMLDLPQTQIFVDLDQEDDVVKYRRYESDYTYWLMSKYFSKKTIYGGELFEEKVVVNGETIKASRWPCTRTYADPVLKEEEEEEEEEEPSGKESTDQEAAAETEIATSGVTRIPEKDVNAASICGIQ